MTGWRALVPIKQDGNAKSRLASILSREERDALALRMARHVLSELKNCGSIASISVLSTHRPDWWSGAWVEDRQAGLNPELAAWRSSMDRLPVMIVHADLPLLRADELGELLAVAAIRGIALATDRAGEGSNALAIADGRPFDFRFGPGSRHLHAAQAPGMTVLDRVGLASDIDTPDDLVFARANGFAN